MSGILKCLKYFVVVFNCLIMLLGLAILSFFFWLYFDIAIASKVNSVVIYLIFFFMGLGTLMVILGFLGCCGALQESRCVIGIFFSTILVMFAFQVAVCSWAYINFDEIEGKFGKEMTRLMSLYDEDPFIKISIDSFQSKFECCGSVMPKDWKFARRSTDANFKLPLSCCPKRNESYCRIRSQHYTKGCSNEIFQIAKDNAYGLVVVLVCTAIIEILAMTFSMILCISFNKVKFEIRN